MNARENQFSLIRAASKPAARLRGKFLSVPINYFGLPHEVGHIMGCEHDRAEALREQARGEPGIGAYPYSYGYLLPGNNYGDIMSYPPTGANRIPYFSNPNVLYGGVPTGVAENQPDSANTALTMNNTAATVEAFRNTVFPGNVITISNSSASQITVTSISPETPAPWLSVSPQGSFSINPGTAQNVTVQVDFGLAPNGFSNVRLLIVTNNASANPLPGGIAMIVDNDTPPPTRIVALSGNLAFGNVAVGSSAQATLTIANTGNATLTVNSISFPAGFSGNWTVGTIAASSVQPVTVTITPTAATSYGGTVTVNSDATSGVNTFAASGIGSEDTTPPVVTITSPTNGQVFTSSPITVNGAATDNVAVALVAWSLDRGGGGGMAVGTTNWTVSGLSLHSGTNVITIIAFDTAGNSASTNVIVTLTQPQPTISSPRLAGQVFSVTVQTVQGMDYALEYKPSLPGSGWSV